MSFPEKLLALKSRKSFFVLLVLAVLGVLALVGYFTGILQPAGTITSDPANESNKAFEIPRLFVLPNQVPSLEELDAISSHGTEAARERAARIAMRSIKPGHWVAATQEMRSNHEDYTGGRFTTRTLDSSSVPLTLPATRYRIESSRPATLPKGQTRHLETIFFPVMAPSGQTMIETRMNFGGADLLRTTEILDPMPEHQFFFVVLADPQDRYQHLSSMPTMQLPNSTRPYLKVVQPPISDRIALSSYALTWTNTAYLLWDNLDPNLLDPLQQQALVDWLHWGGQLIISGPQSLDQLRASFLHAYLPATAERAIDLTATELKPLSDSWAIPNTNPPQAPLQPASSWSGLKLSATNHGSVVSDTGELVFQQQVGRGRVVVTAFPLHQPELIRWPAYDNFLHNCLLQLPQREFYESATSNIRSAEVSIGRLVPSSNSGLLSASRVRFLSRDLPKNEPVSASDESHATAAENQQNSFSAQMLHDTSTAGGTAGVASWNDQSAISTAARESLQQTSGINFPKVGFIAKMLGIYLIILVPVNWLVFRLLRRVEWAWLAAPVISILFSYAVIQIVQLDIGFVRAQREIALVEMQGGYPRGHVTRYLSLYTSLSTDYSFRFDDRNALILPVSQSIAQQRASGQSSTLVIQRDQQVSLSNYNILSNSTALIHSEELTDFQGTIRLIENSSDLVVQNTLAETLEEAAVFRLTSSHQLEVAYLGKIPSGGEVTLNFIPYAQAEESLNQAWKNWSENPASNDFDLKMLDSLLSVNRSPRSYTPGEMRLVGISTQPITGLTVEPKASQNSFANLYVVNLQYPSVPVAKSDTQLPPK